MSEHFRTRLWPRFGQGMQAAQLEPVGWFAERRVERGGENAIEPDEVRECPHRASAGPSGEPECAACGIECGETSDIGLDPIGGRVVGDRLTGTVNGHNDRPVVGGADAGRHCLDRRPETNAEKRKRARSVVEEHSSMVGGDNRTSVGVGDGGELGEGRDGGGHGRVLRSVQQRHSG